MTEEDRVKFGVDALQEMYDQIEEGVKNVIANEHGFDDIDTEVDVMFGDNEIAVEPIKKLYRLMLIDIFTNLGIEYVDKQKG